MQSAAVEHTIQSSGTMASASSGISQKHTAHIRGTLYRRKALAMLRKYTTYNCPIVGASKMPGGKDALVTRPGGAEK